MVAATHRQPFAQPRHATQTDHRRPTHGLATTRSLMGPIDNLLPESEMHAQRRAYSGPHKVQTHLPSSREQETALTALRDLLAVPSAPRTVPLEAWTKQLRGMGLTGGAAVEVLRALEQHRRITLHDGRVGLGR